MKYTAKTAKFIFGEEMKPCPVCQSYNLGYSMEIVMDEEIEKADSAKQILGKWARSVKKGSTLLKGPVFLRCRSCGRAGPSIDCSGRTSEDVGKDPEITKTLKNLWNTQKETP